MGYVPTRDTMFIDLIQLSPVPVNFVSAKKKIGFSFAGIRIGVYYCESPKSKVEPHIEILNSLNKHKMIGTLLHEIGHARCDREKCSCLKSDDLAESEIHAYEYTLEWLLKNKQKKTLKTEIKHIKRQVDKMDYYGDAIKHIMKTELWQKCLNYVK